MFTGLIEALGSVTALAPVGAGRELTVRAPQFAGELALGESVAVNGVCLTVVACDEHSLRFQVGPETLARTNLGGLAAGDRVNLERSLRVGDRLGGHMVQGHVDGVATIVSRVTGEHWDVVRIAMPPALSRYLVEKGSVAVDGVSLTVSALSGGPGENPGEPPWFEVSLIPTTLAATTLGRVTPGGSVNLEVDVIGKYVERMLRAEPEMARP